MVCVELPSFGFNDVVLVGLVSVGDELLQVARRSVVSPESSAISNSTSEVESCITTRHFRILHIFTSLPPRSLSYLSPSVEFLPNSMVF